MLHTNIRFNLYINEWSLTYTQSQWSCGTDPNHNHLNRVYTLCCDKQGVSVHVLYRKVGQVWSAASLKEKKEKCIFYNYLVSTCDLL